jgi:putative transposase
LEELGITISMDGKGRWIDNVFIERLWRAVKHEGVYLWDAENVHELERHLGRWFEDYNRRKPHSALEYRTPWECYRPKEATPWRKAA